MTTGELLVGLAQATERLIGALLAGDVSRVEAATASQQDWLRRLEGVAASPVTGDPPAPDDACAVGELRRRLEQAARLAAQGLAISRRLAGTVSETELAYRGRWAR